MNIRILFFLFISLLFVSCEDKNKPDEGGSGGGKEEEVERPATLAWIEDKMREEYLWTSSIPKAEKLNYTLGEEDFFNSLLSKEDGKDYRTSTGTAHYYYSYIDKVSEATRGYIQADYTYGFEFTTVTFPEENIGALILYVLPNSPASRAKLQRGDWIVKINNQYITTDAMAYSLYGDVAKTFQIKNFDPNSPEKDKYNLIIKGDVNIESAEAVEDNPVFMSEVIPWGSKKVGYLVYNVFNDSKAEGDNKYNNELKTLSGGLYNGVDEFVLDLRYNNGGLLSCVQLLCAILAPKDKLGSSFGYLKYNDDKKANITVNNAMLSPGGQNLNLKTLYVLVSDMSASASEAVINLLNPFMNVVVIGMQTEGKNVGSNTFESSDKIWEMHPITCRIYNSVDFNDYANGFAPDYEMGDVFHYNSDGKVSLVDVLPLGDPNERMLKVALELIDGTYVAGSSRSVGIGTAMYKLGEVKSLDRKATNGVIIDIEE